MSQDEPITLIIVDDHNVVRAGLRAFLDTQRGIKVLGEGKNGEEAVNLALQLKPDVIVLDLVMPVKSGIEAIRELKEHQPEARIVALTSFSDDDKVFPAIKAGALGYVLKDAAPAELLRAIRHDHQGESSLHPMIATKLIQEFNRPKSPVSQSEALTKREIEVLQRVAQGLSNQEIATLLSITEKTVRNYVVRILSKLHLSNRTQAALYALREGLAKLDAK